MCARNSLSSSYTVKVKVTQSCSTLCDPVDCSPPGLSVHGIFQVKILEVALNHRFQICEYCSEPWALLFSDCSIQGQDIINKGWKLNPFLSTCSTVWWRMHLAYGWNKANNKLLVLSLLMVGAGVVAVWCWSGGCIVLEQLWGDSPCPRVKGKPQQDGRRGNIMFRIKPHIHQRRSEGSNKACVHQHPVLSQRLR